MCSEISITREKEEKADKEKRHYIAESLSLDRTVNETEWN